MSIGKIYDDGVKLVQNVRGMSKLNGELYFGKSFS